MKFTSEKIGSDRLRSLPTITQQMNTAGLPGDKEKLGLPTGRWQEWEKAEEAPGRERRTEREQTGAGSRLERRQRKRGDGSF